MLKSFRLWWASFGLSSAPAG